MLHRDFFLTRPINRVKLHFSNMVPETNREDITVIVGVKNRCDYRLVNAFKSLRNQEYDSRLISIILVDYDSNSEFMDRYKEICGRFDVEYLRVENKPAWNRSHCLNIGIKKANTKYICTTDVDIIFEKNYLSECIKELRKRPFQVLLSNFYNSPKDAISGEIDVVGEYSMIKDKCGFQITEMGIRGTLTTGINLALTCFYHAVNGYDERYSLWGSEDFDLIKRFSLLGLKVKDMSSKSSWIHQQHEKQEGVNKIPNLKAKIGENKAYMNNTHTIVRNENGWGETG